MLGLPRGRQAGMPGMHKDDAMSSSMRTPAGLAGAPLPDVTGTPPAAITAMLHAWRAGERGAADAVMTEVYARLHRLAHGALRGERAGHTLRPTALLHETFLRLSDGDSPDWRDRGHFFAVAARTMRRVLVDHARAAAAVRRGGQQARSGGDALAQVADASADPATLLALDAAFEALARLDARKARVVELRCLLGLSVAETARLLAVSQPTVVLDLRLARAWLTTRLDGA